MEEEVKVYEPLTDIASLEPEELDEKEYDIPPVSTLPTLESILNENDGESDEDIMSTPIFSEEDTASISSEAWKRRDKKDLKMPGHLLRHFVLRSVSTQMQSASERVQTGKPTALAVGTSIAIGTFHGVILVFNTQQVLKWCLGTMGYGAEYGSVSALAFNSDCTRLLAGHDKGHINMWDVTNGKLIRSIPDAHPTNTAVLHLKFTDESNLALCSDSGGSVFELNFKRTMGARTCESRCIFSGSRGEVVAVEPLQGAQDFPDHPAASTHLVALATVTKVLVVTIKPSVEVWFTYPLKSPPDANPVLAWHFVLIQVSPSTKIVDPVLAFGRKNSIYFYQVNVLTMDKINFFPLHQIDLSYSIQNFCWVTSKIVGILDIHEKLHLVDVRNEEELEALDLEEVHLVYGSSYFKGLATGGNVSKAMVVMGDRACYYSMAAYKGQLLFLGLESVHVVSLRTWRERIEFLMRKKKFVPALEYIHSLYEDKARIAIGLTGRKWERKSQVVSQSRAVVLTYVEQVMGELGPEVGKVEQLTHHYQLHIPPIIHHCLQLGQRELLFSTVFEQLSRDPLAQGVFLESLESPILDGLLPDLPPNMAKLLVDHLETEQRFATLERCIVGLDVAVLDLHQVMTLSKANAMYDAFIYIHNRAFDDYIGPLEDLLGSLREALEKGKELRPELVTLGNKILVYISCCLAGRAYPWGHIPEDRVASVKTNMYNYLITPVTTLPEGDPIIYPVLRTLIQFDIREFLNVISLAFEEEAFSGPTGFQQRQRLVGALIQIMLENEAFSPAQVGALFTFLARQLSHSRIEVSPELFQQILEYLTEPSEDSRSEERQQTLLELYQSGGLESVVDYGKLLQMAQKAKFYQMCEILYEATRQFDQILLCNLKDDSRKIHAFGFINHILESSEYSDEEKSSLKSAIIKEIPALLALDCQELGQLLLTHFEDSLKSIIANSELPPEELYKLLKQLFLTSDSNGLCSQSGLHSQVLEHYIELMCQFEPTLVEPFLRSSEGYRLEPTLEICQNFKVLDATAYLLEKTGNVKGAFDIFLEELQECMRLVTAELHTEGPCRLDQSGVWQRLHSQLARTIQLCQRHSTQLAEDDKRALWFPILEILLQPQRQYRDLMKPDAIDAFQRTTKELLNNMNGHLPLPTILMQVMQDPAYNEGKFSDIRELVMGMFETYHYETGLLDCTIKILSRDLYSHLQNLQQLSRRGVACRARMCARCRQPLASTSFQLFRSCGHSFHTKCLNTPESPCIWCWPHRQPRMSLTPSPTHRPSLVAPLPPANTAA